MLQSLVVNALLLLAICWLFTFSLRHLAHRQPRLLQLVMGLCFGAACIIGMLVPFTLQSGLIFDARSVVLGIAALFGGPLTAAIAGVLAASYRVWLGGVGTYVGLLSIFIPILLGLVLRLAHERGHLPLRFLPLLAAGFIIHLPVVAVQALLPSGLGLIAVKTVALPFLLTLPLATAVLGLLLNDLAERARTEQALQRSEARLRAITRAMPDLLMVLDEDGRYLEVLTADSLLLYQEPHRLVGRLLHEVFDPEDADRFLAFIRLTLERNTPQRIRYSLQTLDGLRTFEGRAQRLETTEDERRAVVWCSRDITERDLAEQERRIAAIAFESQQGMFITDPQAYIIRVNRAFTLITGYSAEELIGQPAKMLSSGSHDEAFYAALWHQIKTTGSWEGEIWNRRRNGEVFPEWQTITAVRDDNGKVTHYIATVMDITQRKLAEERIHQLAFYDPLTNLPNRRLLLDRLQHALDASERSRHCGAVMFIDLDNFKMINDACGHKAGDQFLRLVAERLQKAVRQSDTVARLGGDEFVVILEDLGQEPEEAIGQASRIGEKLLESLAAPYCIGERELSSSASIGVALFRGDEPGVDELISRADHCMYNAKMNGKNALSLACLDDPVASRSG